MSEHQYSANVILADDAPDILTMLKEDFEDMGFKVTPVENGQLAYDLYIKNPDAYDIIITDMQMPVMDGPTLIRSIREKRNIKQPKL